MFSRARSNVSQLQKRKHLQAMAAHEPGCTVAPAELATLYADHTSGTLSVFWEPGTCRCSFRWTDAKMRCSTEPPVHPDMAKIVADLWRHGHTYADTEPRAVLAAVAEAACAKGMTCFVMCDDYELMRWYAPASGGDLLQCTEAPGWFRLQ